MKAITIVDKPMDYTPEQIKEMISRSQQQAKADVEPIPVIKVETEETTERASKERERLSINLEKIKTKKPKSVTATAPKYTPSDLVAERSLEEIRRERAQRSWFRRTTRPRAMMAGALVGGGVGVVLGAIQAGRLHDLCHVIGGV
jgi:hypothetical protein